jgi:hypothetical protein
MKWRRDHLSKSRDQGIDSGKVHCPVRTAPGESGMKISQAGHQIFRFSRWINLAILLAQELQPNHHASNLVATKRQTVRRNFV